jgi:glycosyltransferase involved in cell wall biosynthesis
VLNKNSVNKEFVQPLVSVIVVTYNSAKHVLETLDSIKNQTYQHLELIICDDSSTDHTIDICSNWLKTNSYAFLFSKIVKSPFNKGIAGNCNLGVSNSSGEWIKMIAGDDLLLPDCISDNVDFISKQQSSYLVFSKPQRFGGNPASMQFSENSYINNEWIFASSLEIQLQSDLNRIPFWYSPTLFFKKDIWKKIKFDEKYPNCEDIPFINKCLRAGYKLSYFPKYTINYRFGHPDSVQNTFSNKRAYYEIYKDLFFYHDLKSKGWIIAWDFLLNYYVNYKPSKSIKLLLVFSPRTLFIFLNRKISNKFEDIKKMIS